MWSPRGAKLRLECDLDDQVAPKRLQVALGVRLGGAKLRLECGLEGVLALQGSRKAGCSEDPGAHYV